MFFHTRQPPKSSVCFLSMPLDSYGQIDWIVMDSIVFICFDGLSKMIPTFFPLISRQRWKKCLKFSRPVAHRPRLDGISWYPMVSQSPSQNQRDEMRRNNNPVFFLQISSATVVNLQTPKDMPNSKW